MIAEALVHCAVHFRGGREVGRVGSRMRCSGTTGPARRCMTLSDGRLPTPHQWRLIHYYSPPPRPKGSNRIPLTPPPPLESHQPFRGTRSVARRHTNTPPICIVRDTAAQPLSSGRFWVYNINLMSPLLHTTTERR